MTPRRALLTGVPVTVVASVISAAQAQDAPAAGESTVQAVVKRGRLLVGMSTFVPWAMRDKNGELIGWEVDVAKQIAKDMGVEIDPCALQQVCVEILESSHRWCIEREAAQLVVVRRLDECLLVHNLGITEMAELREIALSEIAREGERWREIGFDLRGREMQQTGALVRLECALDSRGRRRRKGSLIRPHFDA